MQRHRRKEEANREIDRARLKARVKTALQRLEKSQRQELVKMRQPFIQHVFRVRHLVEIHSKEKEKLGGLYPDMGARTFTTHDQDEFGRDVRSNMQYTECSPEQYITLIMGGMPQLTNVPSVSNEGSMAKELDAGAEGSATTQDGSALRPKSAADLTGTSGSGKLGRPKSAPNVGLYLHKGGMGQDTVKCDWCGTYTNNPVCLEIENDLPASVQRALDSTEYASVALSAPNIDKMIPGPKGIPDIPPLGSQAAKSKSASMDTLKALMDTGGKGKGKGGDNKYAAKCCSFPCVYAWNNKHSPTYLKSRRHLQIDLLYRKRMAADTMDFEHTDAATVERGGR